eukprot:TRINITY_DN4103_c0_g1_i4.p1 TRINITY_DN4103_c0_g1~~TRINITY_DN4103_c0_g1_i4.p1  ORF type:complete len:199 (-),score=22.24 TRINITY_DN4103_c0_g1_i4:141-737(-)
MFSFIFISYIVLVHTINITNYCDTIQGCSKCVQEPGCVWCLSGASCTRAENCLFTPYTDCCYCHSTCFACTQDPACSYCRFRGIRTCRSSSNDSFQREAICDSSGDTCPNQGLNYYSFVFGVFSVIGACLFLFSLGLLIWYFHKKRVKEIAKQELARMYKEKNEITESIEAYEKKRSQQPYGTYTTLAPLILRLADRN